MRSKTIRKVIKLFRDSKDFRRGRQRISSRQANDITAPWVHLVTLGKQDRGFNAINASMMIQILRNYGIYQSQISDTIKQHLYSLINDYATSFYPQGIANTLLALNQMGFNKDNLSEEITTALRKSVESNVQWFNPQEIANTLLALNQMGFNKTCLQDEIIIKLLQSVESNAQGFNPQNIANTLLALNQMGFNKTYLQDEIIIKLLDSVNKNSNYYNSQGIANTLLALNQMGFDRTNLPVEITIKLLQSVESNAQKFNPQNIANTLLALNQMGFNKDNLSEEIKTTLLKSAESNVQGFNSQGIANTLLALNQMGFNKICLSKEIRIKLLKSVESNTQKFNPQEIANTLLALNQMGFNKTYLSKEIRIKLLKSVESNTQKFNPQDIATTLLALNQMGFNKINLPAEITTKLLQSVESNVQGFNPQNIANTLLALNQMGFNKINLPAEITTKLLDSANKNATNFISQGIANTLLALNQMGFNKTNLPAEITTKLLDSVNKNTTYFNPQEIANTLLALSQMGHHNDWVKSWCKTIAVTINPQKYQNKELLQIITACRLMQVPCAQVNVIRSVHEHLKRHISYSTLQRKVTQLLAKECKNLKQEYIIQDCMIVDTFYPEKNWVIEINGPHHYGDNGSLTVKSQQKIDNLNRLGYPVIVISYRDWKQLRTAQDKTDFIKRKLKEGPLASHSVKSLTQGKATSEGSSSLSKASFWQKNNLKTAHTKPSTKAWGNSNSMAYAKSTNPWGSLSYNKAESSKTAMTSVTEARKSNKEKTNKPLDTKEWPTLGGNSVSRSTAHAKTMTPWGSPSSNKAESSITVMTSVIEAKKSNINKKNKPLNTKEWPTLGGGAPRSGKPRSTTKTVWGVKSIKLLKTEETNDCLRTQGQLNVEGKFSA
jgi:hypothetical protein